MDLSVGGDSEAFAGLHDYFADELVRYFYAHVGSFQDAEDLAARTFLRAWRAIGKFRWRGKPFEAWLFTLAKNQLIDFYRGQRRTTAPLDETRPDERPGPESQAVSSDEAAATRRALKALTEEQRQVLVLKFYMDRETSEIAEIMGKKEGTVRALQMRALQALRRQLRNG